ncbi:MAG: hypothetical protein ACK55I_13275, partial [bacterium]
VRQHAHQRHRKLILRRVHRPEVRQLGAALVHRGGKVHRRRVCQRAREARLQLIAFGRLQVLQRTQPAKAGYILRKCCLSLDDIAVQYRL